MPSTRDPVAPLMANEVETIRVDQLISDARRIMIRHHVPVVDGDRLVGMISATDVFALSHGAGLVAQLHDLVEVMPREQI